MTAVSAHAQSDAANSTRVEGTVRDSTGASVSEAQVELKSGAFSAAMPVNPSGDFAFENVPGTSGTITVTANGFQKFQQGWSAASGEPVHTDIVLVPLPQAQQIVVTANRTPTLMSDLPVSDIQLTRDDLQATPALTLDDELR